MTRVGVDVGGTFTDLVAVRPDGTLDIRKVASTPQDPSIGLFRALDALGVGGIEVLVHGTTVATNALLERRGARVALVTTAGFEDLLWLRRQDRPALYDLARDHPPPLVARQDVIGARERMGPDGVIVALSESEVTRVTEAVRALAPPPESVAVALLFSVCPSWRVMRSCRCSASTNARARRRPRRTCAPRSRRMSNGRPTPARREVFGHSES